MKNQTSETKNKTMKIVVIGGTGLIGAKLVNNLRQQGHEVVAASPSQGINSVTGEGLAAAVLADVAVAAPVQGTIEVAGPEPIRLDEVVRRYLSATRDARKVETDAHARYFGIKVNDQSLTPGVNPRLGAISFETWLRTSATKK